MNKKYFIIISVISVVFISGIFLFGLNKNTFYIKNDTPRLNPAIVNQKVYQAEDKISDLSNAIIPKITVPENLTKNFAGFLAKAIIDKNNQPKNNKPSGEPSLEVPRPNKIVEEFIKSGLAKADENILNIKPPELKTSPDNSKKAVETYLNETQKILKDNLKGNTILSILEEINKNNGRGTEKLLPVISAHETAANQIEEEPVPSSVKDLMTEEVRLLRITANVLRALTNIENDPLGALAATGQYKAIITNWLELQVKFNNFTQKLNRR